MNKRIQFIIPLFTLAFAIVSCGKQGEDNLKVAGTDVNQEAMDKTLSKEEELKDKMGFNGIDIENDSILDLDNWLNKTFFTRIEDKQLRCRSSKCDTSKNVIGEVNFRTIVYENQTEASPNLIYNMEGKYLYDSLPKALAVRSTEIGQLYIGYEWHQLYTTVKDGKDISCSKTERVRQRDQSPYYTTYECKISFNFTYGGQVVKNKEDLQILSKVTLAPFKGIYFEVPEGTLKRVITVTLKGWDAKLFYDARLLYYTNGSNRSVVPNDRDYNTGYSKYWSENLILVKDVKFARQEDESSLKAHYRVSFNIDLRDGSVLETYPY